MILMAQTNSEYLMNIFTEEKFAESSFVINTYPLETKFLK